MFCRAYSYVPFRWNTTWQVIFPFAKLLGETAVGGAGDSVAQASLLPRAGMQRRSRTGETVPAATRGATPRAGPDGGI